MHADKLGTEVCCLMSRRRISLAADLATSRRQFILSGASLAVAPWLTVVAQAAPRSTPKFSADPFQLGVTSGEPSPDGMVLWTRLAPAPLEGGGMPLEVVEVKWEVATDEGMRRVVKKGTTLATPQLGHSVHVEVEGLKPDRWYWYRFTAGDARSPIGRTRTTPLLESTPEQLRFAFASCQHFEAGLYTAYEHMVKEPLDLIVFLGDYIYEGPGRNGQVRKHTGPEITELEHYRNRYAQYRSDPHLRAAHALCPWMVVWDDHEVDNNYAGAISEQENVTPDQLLLRRAAAYQAFYEHMPLRRYSLPQGPDMQLYRRMPYGRLADFSMLDTRQYRSDQPNGDGRKPLTGAVLDPQTTMLGFRQEKWLMRNLLETTATWNILAQQIMMGRVDRIPGETKLYAMDNWAGYQVARDRLMRFLADRKVPNPVVLTGDIHTNWVNDLKLDFDRPEEATIATEFVGTSISSGGNGVDKPANLDKLYAENPFVRYHNNERGYVSCTLTPDQWRTDYRTVAFVNKPGAPRIDRATFVVERGRPGAKQA